MPCDGSARLIRVERAVLSACDQLDKTPPPSGHRALFLTLTYAQHTWEPRHISDFILRYRRWAAHQGIEARYVWVAELQKRGVIHYHAMMWVPQHMSLLDIPKPDAEIIVVPSSQRGRKATYTRPTDRPSQVIYSDTAERVQRIKPMWSHGLSQREFARDAVGYLAKYTSKMESKDGGKFPKGARIYGMGGLSERGMNHVRYAIAPGWLRTIVHLVDVDPLLGECEHSVRRARTPGSTEAGQKTIGGYAVRNLNRPDDKPLFIPTPWRVLELLRRSPLRPVPELSVEWRGWTPEQIGGWPICVQIAAEALDRKNRTPAGIISRGPDGGWNWDVVERWPSRVQFTHMTPDEALAILAEADLAEGAELVEATGPYFWRAPMITDRCPWLAFRIPAYAAANERGPSVIYDLAA